MAGTITSTTAAGPYSGVHRMRFSVVGNGAKNEVAPNTNDELEPRVLLTESRQPRATKSLSRSDGGNGRRTDRARGRSATPRVCVQQRKRGRELGSGDGVPHVGRDPRSRRLSRGPVQASAAPNDGSLAAPSPRAPSRGLPPSASRRRCARRLRASRCPPLGSCLWPSP
jgi:hypothetical protein